MGWIIKIVAFVAVVSLTSGFVITKVPDLKQKVVEYINPAEKERRILGELDQVLEDLEDTAMQVSDFDSPEEVREKISKAAELINKAQDLRLQAQEANDKDQGLVRSGMTRIIDSFTSKTIPEITDELKAEICKEQ
ncbi:MAG: hypothetical protein COV29_00290 [Candidatus Yanofskybacteria bacterium CG10_big_fil_rev_8_21_14_0_10_36_16]|uniref:Uncharacterized protein n=1 Tax=Candidatus Yanofskybacteria bacterium CG10_big_fil_rev_8_21_14_0_10_36_16 TaxID=1975096 RepID=A0A2J0Q8K5_9BACT|nr:MAG: hypothetical protein COV29_00290 [Candidatus Yanofskybacteria bacterium CG10_big_fil_rev_8_21_14_0_10_36_16]